MDAQRFDAVVRALVARGSRRAVASAGMLGLLGTMLDESTEARRRLQRARQREQARAEGRKKKKGKKKKKKKGGASTTPQPSTTPPPGESGACDELAFAECFAPWMNEWDARIGNCEDACAGGATTTCEQCLEAAITPLVEPFASCFAQTCAGASRVARAASAQRTAQVAPATCNPVELSTCETRWMMEWMLANLAATHLLKVPALLGAIGTQTGSKVLGTCRQQFGCPQGQDCHVYPGRTEGVCCPTCHRYDPGSQSCIPACAADETCNAFGQCRKTCKICLDYLVDGRYLPCGQVTNNCGEILNCNSCKSNERCENRRCVPKTCARGRGTAAADDCCVPQTCAELGKGCGAWDDGCGDVIDCGECTHLGANAFCDGSTGACSCAPRTFCYGGECGSRPDGCGGTIDCETECASQSRPNGYCDANGQCACRPDTCDSLGKTCGLWRDGCGHSLDCGPRELVCGTSADPICCATGHTCCAHGPDYWGLPSECCDWSVCNRYPGGAYKGCCPAVQQCTEPDGSKACCPEGWTCRGGSSPNSTNCCIMSGQGHEVLHTDSSYCCSGELASLYPHVCK